MRRRRPGKKGQHAGQWARGEFLRVGPVAQPVAASGSGAGNADVPVELLRFRVDLPSRRWLEQAAGSGAPNGA